MSIEDIRFNFEVERHARERWWHEDELVNQRTTWLLTTQGVLGAAFGFIKYRVAELTFRMTAEKPEFDVKNYVETLVSLGNGLVAIGIVSSLVSLAGIYAANRAQHHLQTEIGRNLGVTEHTTRLGQIVALGTPCLCAVAWLLAFLIFRR